MKNNTVHKRGLMSRFTLGFFIVILLLILLVIGLSIFVVKRTEDRVYATIDAPELAPAGAEDKTLIVVLGCGVYPDGSPTPMLRERVNAAVALYKTSPDRFTILMSGDHVSENYAETRTMKRLAVEAGVPETAMLIDRYGLSTYDSIRRVDDQLTKDFDRFVIVSQRYHLYRALYIADSFNLDAVGLDATETRYSGQFMRDLREIPARAKDIVKCLTHPVPARIDPMIAATDYE